MTRNWWAGLLAALLSLGQSEDPRALTLFEEILR
jgi:hypothetical protein